MFSFVFYSEIFFKSMELEFINLKMFDVFDFNAWRLDGGDSLLMQMEES